MPFLLLPCRPRHSDGISSTTSLSKAPCRSFRLWYARRPLSILQVCRRLLCRLGLATSDFPSVSRLRLGPSVGSPACGLRSRFSAPPAGLKDPMFSAPRRATDVHGGG